MHIQLFHASRMKSFVALSSLETALKRITACLRISSGRSTLPARCSSYRRVLLRPCFPCLLVRRPPKTSCECICPSASSKAPTSPSLRWAYPPFVCWPRCCSHSWVKHHRTRSLVPHSLRKPPLVPSLM